MPKENQDVDSYGCFVDKVSGTIQIVGDINQDLASKFRRYLNALSRQHENIIVEINSDGGEIESGFLIIDTINLCSSAVTVRATGVAMSMAAIILACAPKREILENSSVMIHEGSYEYNGKYSELPAQALENKRLEMLTWKMLDKATRKRLGYWQKRCGNKNLYLNAQEAIQEGVVDRIYRGSRK